MSLRSLQSRIDAGAPTVVVIGAGYVGLTVASAAAVAGMPTTAVDLDRERVDGLDAGRLVVPGVDSKLFAEAIGTGRLAFRTDAAVVAGADVVLLCVPTPLIDHRPDLSAVEGAGRMVGEHLRADTLVVLESTTYPGTTEDLLRPLLEADGLRAGKDFLLAYSPERVNPGDDRFPFRDVPRVVGGASKAATRAAASFYGHLVDHVQSVSSCRAAELAKLLENTFRMVNIALVNELAQLCASQGIDTWEVIDAASTKPFGFMRFEPGPGVGGHCIPLDPAYLTFQTRRDVGRPFRLVELAKDVNDEMPTWVTRRVADLLNERGQALNGARILALGVTYKPDVGDVRESAAVHVLAQLLERGADVRFHDPFVKRIDEHGVRLRRSALDDDALGSADVVIVLTPHRDYDVADIARKATLVFDARNAIRTAARRPGNVVVL
jgi:nucleotide sugar dehydrogenase